MADEPSSDDVERALQRAGGTDEASTPPVQARHKLWLAGYLLLFAGIFLSLTVLAVNMLGDGMRDALDPRLARRL